MIYLPYLNMPRYVNSISKIYQKRNCILGNEYPDDQKKDVVKKRILSTLLGT